MFYLNCCGTRINLYEIIVTKLVAILGILMALTMLWTYVKKMHEGVTIVEKKNIDLFSFEISS